MHSNRITHPISFINLWEDTYETVTCAIQSFRPVFIRNISYISDHPTPLVCFGCQKPLSTKKIVFLRPKKLLHYWKWIWWLLKRRIIIVNLWSRHWHHFLHHRAETKKSFSSSSQLPNLFPSCEFLCVMMMVVGICHWQNPNNSDVWIIIIQ